MRPSSLATAAVLAVTAIWGSTFFVIKDAVGRVDPVDFLVVRFAIGAAIPSLLFLGVAGMVAYGVISFYAGYLNMIGKMAE